MNKAQLIAKLEATYEKVGTPILVSNTNGVTTYDTPVFEVKNGAGLQKTVPFYVQDEGEAGESAYLRHAEEDATFAELLKTHITTLEGKNNILKIVVDSENKIKEFAEVTAFVLTNGTVNKVKRFVVKNGESFESYPLA